MSKATIEIEIDLLMDTIPAIVDALHKAADDLQNCTPVRKGLATYFITRDGRDIGALAPWAGARDYQFKDVA